MQNVLELGNQLVLERMSTRPPPTMVTLFLTVVCPCSGSPKCRQRSLCQALKPSSCRSGDSNKSAAILIQRILMEMKELGFPVVTDQNSIHCHVFEDNNGALAIAKVGPQDAPSTDEAHQYEVLSIGLHWTQGEGAPFSFHKLDTKKQPADMLTKPLVVEILVKHRRWLLGW